MLVLMYVPYFVYTADVIKINQIKSTLFCTDTHPRNHSVFREGNPHGRIHANNTWWYWAFACSPCQVLFIFYHSLASPAYFVMRGRNCCMLSLNDDLEITYASWYLGKTWVLLSDCENAFCQCGKWFDLVRYSLQCRQSTDHVSRSVISTDSAVICIAVNESLLVVYQTDSLSNSEQKIAIKINIS